MTLKLGELPIRIRRVAYYILCADEQRFWAKFVSHSLPNLCKRSLYVFTTMVPGFLMSFVSYKWAIAEHKRSSRKDPSLYQKNTK